MRLAANMLSNPSHEVLGMQLRISSNCFRVMLLNSEPLWYAIHSSEIGVLKIGRILLPLVVVPEYSWPAWFGAIGSHVG